MATSYGVTYALAAPSGTVSRSLSFSASAVTELSESVATASTDTLISVSIDVSAVKAFYLVSSAAITVETNSGSAADDTLSLVAGQPYVWHTGSYDTFLLGTDVTGLYITNASGSTAAIELRVIQDATP